MERMLPPHDSPLAPKYWMYEVGGELGPAVEKYMKGGELSRHEIRLIALYLRQWFGSPLWTLEADDAARLHDAVAGIRTSADLDKCIALGVSLGMDPL